MSFNYYFKKHHKRSRLRKKNPYQLESYSSRKQYFPPQTLHVYHRPPTAEKDRMLPSGYTVGQTWGALHKAWLGYCIALYKNEDDKTERHFYFQFDNLDNPSNSVWQNIAK